MSSQEAIIDLMVNQIFKKHGIKKELDMSAEDKKTLKEVVDKLKSDVETFVENEKVTYTEDSAEVQATSKASDKSEQQTQTWNKSDNDVHTIKNFVRKKRRKR